MFSFGYLHWHKLWTVRCVLERNNSIDVYLPAAEDSLDKEMIAFIRDIGHNDIALCLWLLILIMQFRQITYFIPAVAKIDTRLAVSTTNSEISYVWLALCEIKLFNLALLDLLTKMTFAWFTKKR